MEHAIKHAISAALETMEAYRGLKDYSSCGQLADDLFEILFPGHVRTTPSANITPKSVAEVTIPTVEIKEVKTVEVKAKKPVPADAEESDSGSKTKKPRKPLTDEQKAAAKAKRDAKKKDTVSPPPTDDALAETKPVVVDAPKPAKPVKNLEKLNATQAKHLKKVADETKTDLTEEKKVGFLAFVNAMGKAEFDAKKIDVHMNTYLTPAPAPPAVAETEQENCVEVEFDGTTYLVAIGGGRVYVEEDGVTKHVGMCGMGKFKNLPIPTDDE
jgi:hypothetical protein